MSSFCILPPSSSKLYLRVWYTLNLESVSINSCCSTHLSISNSVSQHEQLLIWCTGCPRSPTTCEGLVRIPCTLWIDPLNIALVSIPLLNQSKNIYTPIPNALRKSVITKFAMIKIIKIPMGTQLAIQQVSYYYSRLLKNITTWNLRTGMMKLTGSGHWHTTWKLGWPWWRMEWYLHQWT